MVNEAAGEGPSRKGKGRAKSRKNDWDQDVLTWINASVPLDQNGNVRYITSIRDPSLLPAFMRYDDSYSIFSSLGYAFHDKDLLQETLAMMDYSASFTNTVNEAHNAFCSLFGRCSHEVEMEKQKKRCCGDN